ncbi:PE family protein [Mycobacterium lacus]|uniref:PE family immunomodulator PE35 n=1 Tax=Mycobacterium lacus TaxID=169765 RepID=A0A1X1XNX4_9MYCO|nr:PE family protein [Mycobacterium lacus]MCV7124850.1 PE family protein [Mycobacterium lacus]ORW00481.1 cell motility protein [Mycobacterium lacus]BBX99063.1 PE family immunomodulator PE35 [Mycobacterium lacus]
MEKLSHDPAAADIGTQVSENALSGAAAGAAAMTSVSGLAPAGADEVSAHAARAFASEGIQLLASNSSAQGELRQAGDAVREIAHTYSEVDGGAAGAFV